MRHGNLAIAAIITFIISNLTSSLLISYSPTIQPKYCTSLFQQGKNEIYQDFDPFSSDTNSNPSGFVTGLQKRVDAVSTAREKELKYVHGEAAVDMPVICFDALLPGQRLAGSTSDPTFSEILTSLRLGGSFVMTSLNTKQRKLRRYGTIARIEMVDVEPDTDFSPTSVTFMIAGKRRCEILGCACDMKARAGRWRRDYDPDGEEKRLGWGEEPFVDVDDTRVRDDLDHLLRESSSHNIEHSKWNSNEILPIDEAGEDVNATTTAICKATNIIPLIKQWYALASNPNTYNNIDVVATTRVQKGSPGLRINPKSLLQKVRLDLGPMPPPSRPTALAIWGAALINPVPALGVSTEVRGAVLHVEGAEAKLHVLERGLVRSIGNLNGSMPL